jgi:sortase A
MLKKILTLENMLIILGILLTAIGGIQLITTDAQKNIPQDEVVIEDEGFVPVFVPENAQEALEINPGEKDVTLQAPDIDNQITPGLPTTMPEGLDLFPTPTVGPENEPTKGPAIPDRIIIPKIELDAPVIQAGTRKVRVNGQIFEQYTAPDEFAAGWHPDSALLGEPGNTVLNGHHNVFGEVFGKLVDLESGDFIYVLSDEQQYGYVIANKMILPELGEDVSVEQRLQNARWIMESKDERLTLVTCWPAYSNTHRLIIVAKRINLKFIPQE